MGESAKVCAKLRFDRRMGLEYSRLADCEDTSDAERLADEFTIGGELR